MPILLYRSHSAAAMLFVWLVTLTACGGPAPAFQESAPEAAPAQAPATALAPQGAVSTDGRADARPAPTGEATAAADVPAASSSLVSSTPVAEAAPTPKFREVVVPAGTTLRVRLRTALASDTSAVEDPVRATLESPVTIAGATAVPSGEDVTGTVTSVQRSGKVKGRASLAFRFDRLSAWDETYDVQAARVSRQARATKRKDATKIGIGAGAGALVGAIAGGGKGAAIGTAVGGGAGTGVVLATRGEEVRLPAGTVVTMKLAAALTVRVPVD
jgi:hypothetical protein